MTKVRKGGKDAKGLGVRMCRNFHKLRCHVCVHPFLRVVVWNEEVDVRFSESYELTGADWPVGLPGDRPVGPPKIMKFFFSFCY